MEHQRQGVGQVTCAGWMHSGESFRALFIGLDTWRQNRFQPYYLGQILASARDIGAKCKNTTPMCDNITHCA